VTVTIGVASCPDGGSIRQLLDAAAELVVMAKFNNKRNHTRVTASSPDRIEVEA